MNGYRTTVGILALQGCVDPHIELFNKIGVSSKKITIKEQLSSIDRIVLPGGESSTMLKFLMADGFFDSLKDFCKDNPTWGICAGSILIAKEVVFPSQLSLGVINIKAHRNFYGSQLESFKTELQIKPFGAFKNEKTPIKVDFIRAPLLEALDNTVECLATHNGNGVMFAQGNKIATSFHVELGLDLRLHETFLNL